MEDREFYKNVFESPDDAEVTLPMKRYRELLLAEDDLNALQLGGVGDWDWYDDSLKDHRAIPRG